MRQSSEPMARLSEPELLRDRRWKKRGNQMLLAIAVTPWTAGKAGVRNDLVVSDDK